MYSGQNQITAKKPADENQLASQAFNKYLLRQHYVTTTVLCAEEKDNVTDLRTLNASGERWIIEKVNRTMSVHNECYENNTRS